MHDKQLGTLHCILQLTYFVVPCTFDLCFFNFFSVRKCFFCHLEIKYLLRNAPWPMTANGLLNGSLASRELDSSYLGNIAYTGDYFLRIPPDGRRRWIAHTDAGDLDADGKAYVAVHGHDMNGTKFFTWGQSGPGRFMQGGNHP